MIEELTVRTFKTLDDVTVPLGQVNVFIGANGSGKTNLLEALGVLSAAAGGRVDDQALLARGVRPGVPALYKSAFPARPGKRIPPHLFLGATGQEGSRYEVSLHNPLKQPAKAWRFKTERWEGSAGRIVSRGPRSKANDERGLAALKAVDVKPSPGLSFLEALQDYVLYTPATSVLRGIVPESQPRDPLGLTGGGLAQAIQGVLKLPRNHPGRVVCRKAMGLIDWAKTFGFGRASRMPLSPSAAASPMVVRFIDKHMRPGNNILSGYDASEGALYVLFLAVLTGHPSSPSVCAIDNADHGLNPRMLRLLMHHLCEWMLQTERQILLTTHNPLALDGLPLKDDRVRLFTVSRSNTGRTLVRRVTVDDEMLARAAEGWTLSRQWVMGHLGGIGNV